MKDKPSQQKLFQKIVSVFAALVLWLFVTYTEDALMDINVNSLAVNMVGEQKLLSKGLMLVDKNSVEKASVTIRGRRGDLISVMDSVRASVDLSGIESAGHYDLTPVFDIPSSTVYVSKRNTLSVGVEVEKVFDKTISVSVVQGNADKNKNYVVETTPALDKIKVRGAKEDILKIGRATLYVDVSSVADGEEVSVAPVFEDANGEKIDIINEIYCDVSEIGVVNTLYPKKSVDVKIDFPYELNEKYSLELISQSFDKADVGIISESGESVNIIKASFKNSMKITQGKQKYTLELNEYNGIYIPEKNRNIEVEVNITEKSIN